MGRHPWARGDDNPTIQGAALADFHTVAFAPLILLGALVALVRRRPLALVIWCGLALLIKEQVSLIVALIGLAALLDAGRPALARWPGLGWLAGRADGAALAARPWSPRRRGLVGLLLAVVGVAWFFAAVSLVIPAAIGQAATESPFVSRYGQYGDGLAGMARTFLTRPDIVWTATPKRAVAEYLLALLLGGGLLPLLSPLSLLALPEIAINALSSFTAQRASATHYSLATVPVLIAAAIDGAGRLARWSRAPRRALAGLETGADVSPGPAGQAPPRARAGLVLAAMLALAGLNSLDRGFLPGARKHTTYATTARQAEASAFFALVPPDAVLMAQDNLLPHLSHRRWIYPFAYGFTPPIRNGDPPPAWVLLDVTAAGERPDGRSLEREVWGAPGYGVVAADNGYLLLRQGVETKALPPAFTRFALAAPGEIEQPARQVSDDGRLSYLGATVEWRPDPWSHRGWQATLTSYWQAAQPLATDLDLLVAARGRPNVPLFAAPSPTAVWLPTSTWPPGQIIRVVHGSLALDSSRALTIVAAEPTGAAVLTADLTLTPPSAPFPTNLLDVWARTP